MHNAFTTSRSQYPRSKTLPWILGFFLLFLLARAAAQQPPEPVNINPIDGQAYYLINQLSGMQADAGNASSAAGSAVLQQARSFTSLTQRWAMTSLPGNLWAISNLASGLCLDASTSSGTTTTVQNTCSPSTASQQWSFTASGNGYVTVTNHGTGLLLDVSGGSNTAGTSLTQTSPSTAPTQTQQWLLRPVFFRGVDNALLEKQESERVSASLPWWQDAGNPGDVLQILKNHGINMIRIRPTSEPPYNSYTASSCNGNGCYTETDTADIDLAKRAKQLGMSVELTLLFDGGSSKSIPAAWSSDTLSQAETDVYNYVKSEIEAYRKAGAMPDMVTIGNEVDTGFLGSLASPTASNFGPFAAIQKSAMQAVADASSDTSIGPPLPMPIRCIHITPAWDLTSFFTLVNNSGIPYDAICQSYYPMYHGPLTTAQAAASNPGSQPVEETALINAANSIGKPIFIIETAEHYENGFSANDPWYPPTRAGQRQFLIDLEGVLRNLPNHLGMGLEYWDPAGVNIPQPSGGGYVNGDNQTNAIYTWNGLTLFDNADSSGSTQTTASNYSALLPAADALGGKLDPTLSYKLVNVATGQVLETTTTSTSSDITLSTAPDTGSEAPNQQWAITSNNDGYFQISSLDTSGGATQVLDNNGSNTAGSTVVASSASTSNASQEWNVVTAGSGTFAIVSKVSGLVLGATGPSGSIQQQQPSASNSDWVTPANTSQQWKIIPVYITTPAVIVTQPNFTLKTGQPSLALTAGSSTSDSLTITPSGGYIGTISMSCNSTLANVTCSFSPSTYTANGSNTQLSGTVSISASNAVAMLRPAYLHHSNSILIAGAFFFPGWLLLGIPPRKGKANRSRTSSALIVLVLLASTMALTACGGGGSTGTGGGTSKTVTGTLTITAKGSSGNISQSVAINLTVTQ